MTIDTNFFFIIPLQIIAMLAYFPIARRLKLYDIPNERSSHSNIAFRGGGVIIPISMILYTLFMGYNNYYLVAGVLLVAVVSFYDDYTGANAFFRLIIHFLALGLILMPIREHFDNNPLLIIVVAILGVAAINAYNFMDGINAITGLYTLSVYETILYYYYFYEGSIHGLFHITLVFTLISAVLIFGFYNFRSKAILFAGDVGSVCLGLLSVHYVVKLIFYHEDIIYLSILAVYGVEAGLTILYRLYKRQNIFAAHRMHLFQDLVNKVGMSHLTTSLIYTALQVLINAGMFVALRNGINGYFYFSFVILMLVGLYIILKYQIHKRYPQPEAIHEKN